MHGKGLFARENIKAGTNVIEYIGEKITKAQSDKIAEIQGLEQRLTTFQQSAQVSLQEKEQELLKPILEKAQNAIDVVAEKGKYTYILDSSSGVILYSKDSEDILEKVKLALKI